MDTTSIYLNRMNSHFRLKAQRFLPLLLLALLLIIFFSFHLQQYLSFDALQKNHQLLRQWTAEHYFQVTLLFILFYVTAVAISIPGATFLTLAAGFLFGLFWGTVYTVLSATIGAIVVFFAVRLALGNWMHDKTQGKLALMREGFRGNAFHYLLVLRLIPIFPFWLVNIVPALLNVPAPTFILATFLGIIPGSFIYVTLGHGLDALFARNKAPDLGIIFTPVIFFPLLGLALLALLPLIYQRWQHYRKPQRQKAANEDSFD